MHSWHGSGNSGWLIPVPYVPAVHIVHSSDCICEYFPAGQLLHVANGYEEYFPATQARHVERLVAAAVSEKYPGAHEIQTVAIISEYEPIGHGVQTAAPGAEEYDPPWQSVQIAELWPPPALEDFPGVHFMHEVDPTKA